MKPIRSIVYISITLSCLALLIILLVYPPLIKGIVRTLDKSTQPENLDLRPIPVPVPPPPLATNQPSISATAFPSLLFMGPVPQPISVPTPPVSTSPAVPSLAEDQTPESSTEMTVRIANQQDIIVMMLVFIVLIILVWLHRVPSFHSLKKENAL